MSLADLCSLSPELVIKVLEHLQGGDLVSCAQVRRKLIRPSGLQLKDLALAKLSHSFHDVIKGCSNLQYELELYANGMSDGPSMELDIHSKRQLLQEYRQKWLFLDPTQVTKRFIPIHGEVQVYTEVTAHDFVDDHYSFIQGPSRFLDRIANGFTFPKLDVEIVAIKTYTPQDLIVVLIRQEGR